MPRSYREGHQQRHHKHRTGQILVPHGPLSGLLFSVNPRQELRAMREVELYLSTLVEDIQRAHEKYLQIEAGEPEEAPSSAPTTTSSLLLAELSECVSSSRKRGRNHDEDNTGEDGVNEGCTDQAKRRPKRAASSRWLSTISTGCKGYLFVNIPVINPSTTCIICHSGKAKEVEEELAAAAIDGDAPVVVDEGVETPKSASAALPPHSIVVNPLVSQVVERIFKDLHENPRPVFRQCFRLFPVELTCCPTLTEMEVALRQLLAIHFPAAGEESTAATHAERLEAEDLSAPIPFCPPLSSGSRTMFTVSFQLSVKNNTNVETKKRVVESALRAAIPANRFIVVPPSSNSTMAIAASISVTVANATCLMGIQPHYSERHRYNLHSLGESTLRLDETVDTATD